MSNVTMRHPDLPGQEIDVAEAAVPVHGAAGWERVPDEELDERRKRAEAELHALLAGDTAPGVPPELAAPAVEAPEVPDPPAARKRRRATEGE